MVISYQIFLLLVKLVGVVQTVEIGLDPEIMATMIPGTKRRMKTTIQTMMHLFFVFFRSSSSYFVHSRQLS